MAATSTTANAPSALTFPREIFAALQPRQYLLAHLSPASKSQTSVRPNGRKPTEFRKLSVNTDSLTHCNGSAVVRMGNTAVVCGVRGEILLARDVPNPPTISTNDEDNDRDELARLGLLVPNVELSTGSNPSHIPGQAPSGLAQSLASRLLQLLSTTGLVASKDLRIWYQPIIEQEPEVGSEPEIIAYWTLYLDILYISLDGAALDAAWLAMLAALRSVKLPKAWWDPDMEAIICSDSIADAKALSLRGLPIPAGFAVFDETPEGVEDTTQEKGWILADPDQFEEEHCREHISVVVDMSGDAANSIRAIDKRGGSFVDVEKMRTIVDLTQQRWKECKDVLDAQST
ncbi:ribosomal protein S5 domain 2-like protein [Pseudovirgaria hyperparasitica]|uniref:Ribosomal RNA-processing protein 43 n=1 Tax=Pseudovirgaria hyperparasitica TaxID=470096 RepID=A0A6A6WK11_9PEZI|nr:ribosomal protein S5 domain 2-like protein [Pseudovirgaria hyperparasitica]KAF2762497.1 ribosomal protein S5 domain 2-like protein [Pseudovirgaria hyperparasitica]